MTKNKELRKKLEEKEIRDGWAKPKKNYTGFEEDDGDNTKQLGMTKTKDISGFKTKKLPKVSRKNDDEDK